ncbi:MAG: hypothetical protein AMK72_04880 [Planctomycetes bacterium SM23_25]|nr:MAG: hypothetical protein AMK72_04880 [Planctomycetes bacterium SM23_25]
MPPLPGESKYPACQYDFLCAWDVLGRLRVVVVTVAPPYGVGADIGMRIGDESGIYRRGRRIPLDDFSLLVVDRQGGLWKRVLTKPEEDALKRTVKDWDLTAIDAFVRDCAVRLGHPAVAEQGEARNTASTPDQ